VIRIGTSGWSYEHWRGVLYPERGPTRDWLERYAAVFDTVEVNASFYRLPARETVRRWAEQVPRGFCFAVKASRYLTHVRRLREPEDGIALLEERLQPLGEHDSRGPLLWQLPPDFRRDDERLAGLLEALPPGRHAIEFRNDSWRDDDVYELLRAHGVALVVAHRFPEGSSPWVDTAGWWYLRLHRGSGERGRYPRRQLERWAERIEHAPGDVYAYFNNDWEGFAVENARSLVEILGSSAPGRRDAREAA
jgi:uncharacterized protein YecE (DUF72 family)